MTEIQNPQAPDLDPKFTKGQLEHAQKLLDAGVKPEEIETGAQEMQNEIDRGRAEVIGSGAVIAALAEEEQVINGGEGRAKNVSRRHVPVGPNKMSEKMEVPNMGAVLIGELARVDGDTKIGDGTSIGAFTNIPFRGASGVRIGNNVEIGDYGYVAGEVDDGTKLGEQARIKQYSKVGKNVKGGDGVTLEEGAVVEDDVTLGGDNRIFGTVGSGSSLDQAVNVLPDAHLPAGSKVEGEYRRVTPENADSFVPADSETVQQ